jgi:hypothetical protein
MRRTAQIASADLATGSSARDVYLSAGTSRGRIDARIRVLPFVLVHHGRQHTGSEQYSRTLSRLPLSQPSCAPLIRSLVSARGVWVDQIPPRVKLAAAIRGTEVCRERLWASTPCINKCVYSLMKCSRQGQPVSARQVRRILMRRGDYCDLVLAPRVRK